ncbi:MAG: ABC transporter ATP-binding protein [Kiritimatiellae bacterium]|nr:ABC transporter ATP-binding protein [Kiritimatiellia bacterium]
MLKLDGVTKSYGPAGGEQVEVLKGIDLSINYGDSVAVVGPSGSGKSTLLNVMGTLDSPTAGFVFLDGEDVSALGDKALAAVRNRKIGFVFQLHHLLPQCTVMENVMVPTLVGVFDKDAHERALRLLDRVGLSHRLSHRPEQLSGGECQRVAVVRALINKPSLLLADEPTGSLDRHAAEALCQLLMDLNKDEETAIVMVTHSVALAENMGRVMEIEDGAFKKG